jgi:undecaprenyl-diphosphatase
MEREILLFVQNHIRTEFLNGPVVFITKLGNAGIYWFCVLFILMCIPRTRKAGFTAFVSMGIVYVLDIMLLKNIVCRMRPYDAIDELVPLVTPLADYSFPSGHSACSFAVSVVMFRMLPKYVGIPHLILAFFIALSRIYVGVHYPTDVLAGACTGALFALLAEFGVNRFIDIYKQYAQHTASGKKRIDSEQY